MHRYYVMYIGCNMNIVWNYTSSLFDCTLVQIASIICPAQTCIVNLSNNKATSTNECRGMKKGRLCILGE